LKLIRTLRTERKYDPKVFVVPYEILVANLFNTLKPGDNSVSEV